MEPSPPESGNVSQLPRPGKPTAALDTNTLATKRQRRLAILDRRRLVWEAKVRGFTTEAIAKQVGISERAVQYHVAKMVAKVNADIQRGVTQYVAESVALLDGVTATLYKSRGDPNVAKTILAYNESKRRLLGVDAPTRSVVGVARVAVGVEVTFEPGRLSDEQLLQLETTLSAALVPATIDVTPAGERTVESSNVVPLPTT